jgi:hypothetical protein
MYSTLEALFLNLLKLLLFVYSQMYVLCVTYIPVHFHSPFRPAADLGKNRVAKIEYQKTSPNTVQCTACDQSKHVLEAFHHAIV